MKNKFGMTASAVLIILSVIWILSIIPFNQKVKHTVPAKLYENGVAVDETEVYIEGVKSNPLFRKNDSFHGKFHIRSYEKTTRDDVNAGINWSADDNIQTIRYLRYGLFETDIMYHMLISEDMTKFALTFNDGRVLATSDELYELYARHFTVTGANSMSIEDIEGIPIIQ